MVSFHESISSNQRKISNQEFFENSSEKKRRWGDREVGKGEEEEEEEEENFEKESKKKQSKGIVVENTTKSLLGIEFHLETPSSFEDWKQCLNIQSGEVHFYNTRNKNITYKDPRQQQQQQQSSTTTDQEKFNSSNHHMSLELELNLPCESLRTHLDINNNWSSSTKCDSDATKNSNKGSKQSFNSSVKRCPSWMSFEVDQQEMVAAACMRCHMLVMLCKSSPSCPNCKFMHPPDHQSPSNLFKPRRFSPLHCKD